MSQRPRRMDTRERKGWDLPLFYLGEMGRAKIRLGGRGRDVALIGKNTDAVGARTEEPYRA